MTAEIPEPGSQPSGDPRHSPTVATVRTDDRRELEGRAALVTGSTRGIGRAIARRLAAGGAAVAVNGLHRADLAERVVEEIGSAGGKAVALLADVSRPDEIRRLFDEAEAALGPLDIVVANAGTAVIKPVVECTEEDFDHVFGTNTRGVYFTMQEAARRVGDGGRILVTSTGGTRMWFTNTSLYLGSKGAVEQFVRSLSQELGARSITVNAVAPGFTDTDLLPERDRAGAASASPLGRIGAPEDVAEVAAFLASDAARWVTGQTIQAGGGVA